MTAPSRTYVPDFLILAQEEWDQIERRNQLLVRALAERNPSTRFLFVERALRARDVRRWRWPKPVQVAANIWTVQPIRPLSDSASQRLSDRAEAAQAVRAGRLVGLDRPFLWSQDPHAADLLGLLSIGGFVYDLTDNWAAFESEPGRRAQVQARIDALTRQADVVLACSRALCETTEHAGVEAVYVPNAIDGLPAPAPVPAELDLLPRPRLGYSGTLHSARLDIDLLVEAARLRAGWSFVFLGPDLLSPRDRARLFAGPNVHHLGTRPHAEVARYISGFDIGLVPNLVTEFTESLDPLKTYEYLAMGLPVLASAAGVSEELAEYVNVVTTASELVAGAEQLLAADNAQLATRRRSAVQDQTWDARAALVECALGVQADPLAPRGVSVVIVSFNTRELLRRCLLAVRDQGWQEIQIIVVDNGSSDGTQSMVTAQFPDVELIELDENVGFGAANNRAFERCHGEFLLLLNSDAMLHEGALAGLMEVAQRHPEAAVVGPRLVNGDETLQRSAWPFPGPARLLLEAFGLHRILRRTPFYEDLGIWDHRAERAVDFLSGACLLVRVCALKQVRGFDEDFYMYAEESDLQRRLQTRGWAVIFTPSATVTHLGGASAVGDASRLTQFYSGQMRFLRKHGGCAAVLCGRLALLIGSVLRGRWSAARVALGLGHPPINSGD